MDQAALDAFKIRVRLMLIEKLLLRIAFEEPVLNGRLTGPQSRDLLEHWLDQNSEAADAAYGRRFKGDPAQSALFAEEVRDVTETMKATVAELLAEMQAHYEAIAAKPSGAGDGD